MTAKKIGRPTAEPKTFRLDIRMVEDEWNTLEKHCEETGKTKPQAIRDWIRSLKK